MQQFPPELREAYADTLCHLIREWIQEGDAPFEIELTRGVEWCRDARTGERKPRANPTLTLTVKINGGAAETEGPPIVPGPPLFRGPSA